MRKKERKVLSTKKPRTKTIVHTENSTHTTSAGATAHVQRQSSVHTTNSVLYTHPRVTDYKQQYTTTLKDNNKNNDNDVSILSNSSILIRAARAISVQVRQTPSFYKKGGAIKMF